MHGWTIRASQDGAGRIIKTGKKGFPTKFQQFVIPYESIRVIEIIISCPLPSDLDEIEEVHDTFLHAQRVIVILRNLERHELRNFCEQKKKHERFTFTFNGRRKSC